MGLWKETLRGSHWVILHCILVGIIFAQGETNSNDGMHVLVYLFISVYALWYDYVEKFVFRV